MDYTHSMKKEEEKKEHFTTTGKATFWSTYILIHFLAFLFALYLSFKCHGGFDLGSFIVAFFCPWIYIIYTLAKRKGFCFDYVDGKPTKI